MEGRTFTWLFIFALICLVLPSVLGRRGGHRNRGERHGGWDCKDEYDDDDDDHLCCEIKQKNVTVYIWTISRCNTTEMSTKTPSTTQKPENSDGHSGGPYGRKRRSSNWGGWCWKMVKKIITLWSCEEVCCEGWKMDAYGKCTIRASETADIVCENGGTKTDNGECMCRFGFSGKTCSTATCAPSCQNFGECQGKNGYPVCICPDGFTGKQCETPVCEHECQNGGECMSQGYGSSCVCSEFYEGNACEHRIKTGSCPVMEDDYSCYRNDHLYKDCIFDDNCDGTEKCCYNGCKMACLKPELPQCEYNGKKYDINATFSSDLCTTCTCLYPGKNGIQCSKLQCPQIKCEKYKQTTDMCCPLCEDIGISQGHGPVFSSCPKSVEAHVLPNSNKADISLNPKLMLKAQDYTGKEHPVQLSKRFITHCACNDTRRNMHHVVATSSPDQYGRFANCTIPVKVVDPYPPKLRCPTSIRAFEGEIIWDKPVAEDNVGVDKLELKSRHKNNTRFVAGEYLVVYIARDFEGNEAVCTFYIYVYTTDTEKQFLPPQLQTDIRKEHHKVIIGGILGAIALAAIFLTILLCLCCFRRRRNQESVPTGTNGNQNAFDNNAYAVYGAPPTYDNVLKEKLPDYIVDPPVYEVIESLKGKEKGVDNPTYGVADENEVAADDVEVTVQQNTENDEKE